jgi:pyruvate/2-oxoglutarate/acetoin dehydrogenase E1 component
VPGLRVAAPTNPHDAKGCLLAAIREDDPVMFVEHRLLYPHRGPVPEAPYAAPVGKARVVAPGRDVTLVGISHALVECLRARRYLEGVGIQAEVVDPIWLAPLDTDSIARSAARTGKLVVVDNGWTTCGAGAEIVARVVERLQGQRQVLVRRLGFAPTPCPPTPSLEQLYYPDARTIAAAAYDLAEGRATGWLPDEQPDAVEIEFRGPF